jgi:hypothetical protein
VDCLLLGSKYEKGGWWLYSEFILLCNSVVIGFTCTNVGPDNGDLKANVKIYFAIMIYIISIRLFEHFCAVRERECKQGIDENVCVQETGSYRSARLLA